MGDAGDPNAEAIEAWNTVLFDKFVRFRDVVTDGLGGHGDAVLRKHPPREGARVLDVGCGFGDTTQQIAKLVGPKGEAVGVDAAPRFIEGATDEAKKAGVTNARFFVADVQEDDLQGPYEQVFARFGTMFFNSPVAALKNMRKALAPGGKMSIVVWRKREDNPCFHIAELIARKFIPEEAEKHDQPTCGPGPFSMSGADMVSEQIQKAGFQEVSFERHDSPIVIGRNLAQAIEFAMALGPAGEIVRLAKEEGEKHKPQVIAALKDAFGSLTAPDGSIVAPSSTWIITGRA